MSSRVPPNDVGAERALLGGILLRPSALEGALDEGLAPKHLYARQHGLIFGAMVRIHEAGGPVDAVTVVGALQASGDLDAAGGASYVSQLEAMMPTAAHVPAYARSLLELAQMRRVLDALLGAVEDVYEREPIGEVQRSVAEVFDEAHGTERVEVRHISEYASEAVAWLEGTMGRFVPTGLGHLDEMLGGGLECGRLTVIAARPKVGKSALGLEIVRNAATKAKVGVGVVSLEMGGSECTLRLWAQEARDHTTWSVSPRRIRNRQAAAHEYNGIAYAQGVIGEAPIWIADQPGASIHDIRRVCRRLHRREGIGLIVVDYLQLMEDGASDESKANRIAEITKGLKNLARELDIPVVLLSQLNRKCEERKDKRPQASDLRDSGAIEQDLDSLLLLWRPELYGLRISGVEGKTEVQVALNRNGPTGSVWLRWDGPSFSLSNLSKEEWPR